jgi:hypothetical protein
MSLRDQPTEADSAVAETSADAQPSAADPAGRTFRQLTVVPALLAMAWLLVGLPLLLLGHFTSVLMIAFAVPLAAILLILGYRWISGPSQGLLAARGAEPARTPWWVIVALVIVAIAFGVDQFIYHSQQIIVLRDPASYIQFGNWIARHGSLPIPQDRAAFGGYNPDLSFNTAAFYQVGSVIVPQFMAGLPMTLAASFWVGGIQAAAATGALLGACGVLVFGGLVGRLVGPRWAPLGALILALSLPEQYTSRSTYSETLTQVLLLGGLCLILDSFAPGGASRQKLAALGGLALGLTILVRIDGASDLLPLIPYCGLLVLGRRRQGWPLIAGLVVGIGYGAVDGVVLSYPYLNEIRGSLIPLLMIAVFVLIVTAVLVAVRWRRGLPALRTDWLPNIAAALAFVVTLAFAIRPYVQTVVYKKTSAELLNMARLQRKEHLPVQPDRMYYEISLHWMFWYLGIPAVILATIGAAILARRCLRGNAPAWTLPLMAFAWIIVSTLYRPSVLPDQPWASRRLVPGVLPGFIVLGLWATSWFVGWLRERGIRPVFRAAVVVVAAAAVILPTVKTSFGITERSGSLAAVGLADRVTFGGEIPAVEYMCKQIPADATVVFVDKVANTTAQVVRGVCGVPTALALVRSHQQIDKVIAGIRRAGRRPVLLAGTPAHLVPFSTTLQPRRVMRLRTRGDPHQLVSPPVYPTKLKISVWMLEFPQ